MADPQEIPIQASLIPQDSVSGQLVRAETKRRLLRQKFDQLRAENEATKKELAELKSRPTDKTVEQLRTELAEIKHRKVFDKLAFDAKVRPQALEDLWKLGNFKIDPYVDEVDSDALRQAIQEMQKEKPYMFGEDVQPAPEAKPDEKMKPGPGHSRGGLVRDAGKFRVTRRELRDPQFMQLNQKRLHEEFQKDNVEIID